jgi:hypothetical protein
VKESSIELFEITKEEEGLSILSYGEQPLYATIRSSVTFGSYFIYCTQNDIAVLQLQSETHTWERVLREGLIKNPNELQQVGALMRRHNTLLGISAYHDTILFTRFLGNEQVLTPPVLMDLQGCIIDWSFKEEIAIVLTQRANSNTQFLKIIRVNQDSCSLEYDMSLQDLLSNTQFSFPLAVMADPTSHCLYIAFEDKQITRITFTEPYMTNIEIESAELIENFSSWIILRNELFITSEYGNLYKYDNGNLKSVETVPFDSIICAGYDLLVCIGRMNGMQAIDIDRRYHGNYSTPMPILDAVFVDKKGKEYLEIGASVLYAVCEDDCGGTLIKYENMCNVNTIIKMPGVGETCNAIWQVKSYLFLSYTEITKAIDLDTFQEIQLTSLDLISDSNSILISELNDSILQITPSLIIINNSHTLTPPSSIVNAAVGKNLLVIAYSNSEVNLYTLSSLSLIKTITLDVNVSVLYIDEFLYIGLHSNCIHTYDASGNFLKSTSFNSLEFYTPHSIL